MLALHPRETHADSLKAKAHKILDDARAGLVVTLDQINWALRITGDLS